MIKKFFISNKKSILILVIVFAVELLTIFVLSQINGIEIFFRGDGRDYQNLANNLIYHQTFAITPEPPYLPTNFRTPIYPFWLAFIYLIFQSYNTAIFVGALVFAISALLVYLIGREIFTEKIALITALLFGLEPWALFQAGFLAAEQIFMPIFLFSIYLFLRYLKSQRTHYFYRASLFLGFVTLVRPLVTFFILIFIFLAFIYEFNISAMRAFKTTLLGFLVFLTILSPWLIRNKIVLNTWQISSISSVSLYVENYMMLEKYLGKMKESEDINEKARILLGTGNYEEATKAENAKILGKTAFKEIKSNFGSYIAMHLDKLPLFLLRNSYGNIFLDLKIPGANIQSNIGRHLLNKDFASLFALVKNAPIGSKILIAVALFWPLIVVLAIVGIFAKFKADQRNLIFWFFILWIGYFLALVGNLRDISRYKLTVNAPLFMFAVYGFYKIKNYFCADNV